MDYHHSTDCQNRIGSSDYCFSNFWDHRYCSCELIPNHYLFNCCLGTVSRSLSLSCCSAIMLGSIGFLLLPNLWFLLVNSSQFSAESPRMELCLARRICARILSHYWLFHVFFISDIDEQIQLDFDYDQVEFEHYFWHLSLILVLNRNRWSLVFLLCSHRCGGSAIFVSALGDDPCFFWAQLSLVRLAALAPSLPVVSCTLVCLILVE